MFSIGKHDDSTNDLTLKELAERKESEIQASIIHNEIVFGIKLILTISLIFIVILLISYLL